ncbi:nitroreductase family protein [Pseudalkalibacillus caeni]|uniref:Nitroreductase family protein n=1 Tax=Exobacillus caeni TaxID=2574798 RepID=A0A5R9F4E0_9BACL|nr:nitroreductase family protein [Pseudalkalibacillus caeni]TLS35354.1 nitroreductase family protein [Pseudalkalibacillus caeni]
MQATIQAEDILQVMKDRKSVRKYKQNVKIPDEELTEILEATVEAPSSWNLQHWRFLIVQSEEQKEKLYNIAYHQQQVMDSSVTIAVLGDLEADKSADEVYGEAVRFGYMDEKVKETLVGNIEGAYKNIEGFARDEAILNSSLAAMQLMLAAKAKGYDSVPMGGFNREAFKSEFNVPERFTPVMLISIGEAAVEAHSTGRFPLEKVVINESF